MNKYLKPIKPLRTIEEYIKAKKKLSVENFTAKDIEQIKTTTEGFFIVNNCKIPIREGCLLLNQWISRHEKTIVNLTEEQKKTHRKMAQKAYRVRQKAIKNNLITIDEEPSREMTTVNMSHIFRTYGIDEKRKASSCPKRLITAIRTTEKPKVHYGQYKAKFGANIPIQHLIQVANYLRNLAKDKGEKSKNPKEFRSWLIDSEKGNKHYVAKPLYLIAVNGARYQYTEKGLIEAKP